MKLLIALQIALTALRRNKMRSALTMLGIVIGVAAVISMVSFGQGASASIQEEISARGSNLVIVYPGSASRGGVRMGAGSVTTLTAADAEAVAEVCSSTADVAPLTNAAAQVVYRGQNWNTSVEGTTGNYASVRSWTLAAGVFFTDQDVRSASRVAVLGSTVVENLFGNENPVDKTIRVKNVPFRVVGVLASKGQSLGTDQDDVVIVPYTTAQKRLMGVTHINRIMVSVIDPEHVEPTTDEIAALLRQRHRIASGEEDDFHIRTQQEMEELGQGATQTMTLLLAGIASVSLLVGGIGIMNIMLVSVTERTREIGLRMAVGARSRDILLQFLIEALVLSALGGTVGIGLALTGSELAANVFRLPSIISVESVMLAFSFAGTIGVFFGFYPARKASRLDPIEALHYE
jgi:putative ABC transport system permease protein